MTHWIEQVQRVVDSVGLRPNPMKVHIRLIENVDHISLMIDWSAPERGTQDGVEVLNTRQATIRPEYSDEDIAAVIWDSLRFIYGHELEESFMRGGERERDPHVVKKLAGRTKGRLLRNLREEYEITLAKMAEWLRVSPATVDGWERGEKPLSLENEADYLNYLFKTVASRASVGWNF